MSRSVSTKEHGPRDGLAAQYGNQIYPESLTQAAGAAMIFQDGWDAAMKYRGEFFIWGTDGCKNCDTGRITLFARAGHCFECLKGDAAT